MEIKSFKNRLFSLEYFIVAERDLLCLCFLDQPKSLYFVYMWEGMELRRSSGVTPYFSPQSNPNKLNLGELGIWMLTKVAEPEELLEKLIRLFEAAERDLITSKEKDSLSETIEYIRKKGPKDLLEILEKQLNG